MDEETMLMHITNIWDKILEIEKGTTSERPSGGAAITFYNLKGYVEGVKEDLEGG